jgi:hypothetical protein
MGNQQPVLGDIDPLTIEIANYIKEAKIPKDMLGYIAIAELIIERVRNGSNS